MLPDRTDPEAPKLRDELAQVTTGQFEAGLVSEPVFRKALERMGFTAREVDDHVRLHRRFRTVGEAAEAIIAQALPFKSGLPDVERCSDCPPADYPTDETRCRECPRRSGARS